MRTVPYLLAVGLALVPAVVRADEIHDAAAAGDVAKVKQLLAADPELVNARGEHRYTPLHFAATTGRDEVVLLLIDRGARLEELTDGGLTALQLAVVSRRRTTAGILLALGADVNSTGRSSALTPLHHAVADGNSRMVELLLCYGANVNPESKTHITPLGLAIRLGRSEIADMLRHAGAKE